MYIPFKYIFTIVCVNKQLPNDRKLRIQTNEVQLRSLHSH